MCFTIWFNAYLVITDFVGRISGLGEDFKKKIISLEIKNIIILLK